MSDTTVFEFTAGPYGAWPTEADIFIPQTGEFGHFRSRAGTSLVISTAEQYYRPENVVAEFRVLLPTPEETEGTDAQWRLVAVVPTAIVEQLITAWVKVHLVTRAASGTNLLASFSGAPGSARLSAQDLESVGRLAADVRDALAAFEKALEDAGE